MSLGYIRIAVFVGLAAILSGCDEWFSHQRAFEVTVDLTVEGQRMQITRRILCEGEVRRDIGMRSRIQYRSTTRSFGERLPSGGAVMVVTPHFCTANRKEGSTSDLLKVSKGHIPYIGWTDNAERPNIIETYVSPGYFERSNGRVRYHGMTARIIDADLAKAGAVDAFDWFGGRITSGIRYGFNAVKIPAGELRALDGVSASLKDVKSLSRLSDKLNLKIGASFPIVYGASRLNRGLGLVGTPRPDRANGSSRLSAERAHTLNTFYPLFKINGGFGIRPGEQGYFVFYRSSIGVKDGTPSTMTFEIGDDSVVLPATGRTPMAVYDPNTRTVYSVKVVSMRFPPSK
ncbi:MAG: hypothetical protein MJE12_25635 [Alphaproteobacteria bacterium]|nr:hypothetical protein [Alphaproteobacteria bacterium]